MPAEQVRHYLQRAKDFLEGMKLTREDKDYWNSSALLAIHSAVAYSDALRAGLGDQKLSADDHRNAVDVLQQALFAESLMDDMAGFKHLRFLLSKKTLVAYGDRRVEHTEYEALIIKAARFAVWADRIGRRLKIEGWDDDDQ
jgi:hypothetical protein